MRPKTPAKVKEFENGKGKEKRKRESRGVA
jgi:hypothetical protein